MGVSVVVGTVRHGLREVEVESGGGVGQIGGTIQGGSGSQRDARPGMRAGRTKLSN